MAIKILICKYCGKKFTNKYIKRKYCSLKCYHKSLIGIESKKKTGIIYKCDECKKKFYLPKWRIRNSKNFFCSLKCLNIFQKDKNTGKNNPNYKFNVTYQAAHNRVRRERGKPIFCEHCKTKNINKRYEWANVSGNYGDINDYIRLCKSCHNIYDNKKNNKDKKLSKKSKV